MTGTTPTETSVREVTDRDFEAEVERSPEPTVVIFVSAECPHCRTLMPYVEGFARDFRKRVRFVNMDVVANPWTAERYGIRGTPTFKFFCHGRPVQELVGAILPAAIKRQVEEFVVHGEECVRKSTETDYEISGYG
jgi:thioredoxin 1